MFRRRNRTGRRPRLNGDVIETAVVENHSVTVYARVLVHVHVETAVDHSGVGNAELELIYENASLRLHILIEQFNLVGIVVRHAEVSDLFAVVEDVERLGNSFRLTKSIGTVEKQKIKIIHFKSLQTLFYAGNDVFLIEIVRTGFDSALCLNKYLITERGFAQRKLPNFSSHTPPP